MSTAVEQHEIKEAACPECGVVLQGRYCHACGERRPDREDLQLKYFLHHAVHELTHFDSKIFRTLKALVVQPGFLTTEYLAGRKHRYFLPFRLFLVIFALNLFLYTRPGIAIYDIGFLAKNDEQGLIQRKLDHAAAQRQLTTEALSERINTHWEKDISTLQFGDVFFFACLAALVFHNRRRYFVEHLIFSLHTLSFVFLFSSVLWPYYLFSRMKVNVLIPVLSFIVSWLYLWRASARVYAAGRSEALMKSLLLVAGLMAVRTFFIMATLILALLQTFGWS